MTEQNIARTPFPAASLLGYPRIGRRRELKKAVEAYWAGKIDAAALDAAAKDIQLAIARRLQELGLTEAAAVPGTFSYYDQVLDTTAHLGPHGRACIQTGNSRTTVVAALVHCFPYIGFPRAVAAIRAVKDL